MYLPKEYAYTERGKVKGKVKQPKTLTENKISIRQKLIIMYAVGGNSLFYNYRWQLS